jgi:hypothetical protein
MLSHQAKDLAAAVFAAVICPPPRRSADQTKSLSAQRASRDPSPVAQDDIDSLAAVNADRLEACPPQPTDTERAVREPPVTEDHQAK